MKKIFALIICTALSASAFAISSSDSLGLPGDNLDLYATLDLFKKSESPEAFEKALNDKSNGINNLDLNNDGEVDYIKVIDNGGGDAHAFALQVPVNENESQDVAVIEIEKSGTDEAHIQIVGDEDLYGKNYIVEPVDEQQAKSPPPSVPPAVHTTVFVNVWHWRPVRYIYAPSYIFWRSPWRWRHYPGYWHPWRPYGWTVYYRRVHPFHYPYYHRTVVYRVNTAHKVYYGHRTTSVSYQKSRSSYSSRQINKPDDRKAAKKHSVKKNKRNDRR